MEEEIPNGSSELWLNSVNVVPDVCQRQDDRSLYLTSIDQLPRNDSDVELLGKHQSLVESPTRGNETHDLDFGKLSTTNFDKTDSELIYDGIESLVMNGTRLELVNNADLLEEQKLRIGFREIVVGGARSTRSDSRSDGAGGMDELRESTDSSGSGSDKPAHCHMGPPASTDKLARNQMITVVVLCLTFMIGETVGGVLSNSLALFTDVVHLGSDLISFIISLLAIYLSTKPASHKMSFGYHRAGNPLPPHRLLFPISSKVSFICTFPQTGQHIPVFDEPVVDYWLERKIAQWKTSTEVLGALFSVFLIWLVSGVLCYIAVERIVHEHYKDVKPNEMLITASLGVAFNVIMGFVLHSEHCCHLATSHQSFGHGHSHSHSHSHSQSHSPMTKIKKEASMDGSVYQRLNADCDDNFDSDIPNQPEEHRHKNMNVRAAFIHVVGDIIQSIGVLVAALIIKFKPEEKYRLADPICTFLFSLLVLITTVTILRDALRVMLEGVPKDISYPHVRFALASLQGVKSVHSLHIWSLTIDRNSVAVHIAIDDSVDSSVVLAQATMLLQKDYNLFHTTIQVEQFDADIMSTCIQCQDTQP